jgi:HD-GYP domain-containing protein (c-di-GMP phosphodiesterase class II)
LTGQSDTRFVGSASDDKRLAAHYVAFVGVYVLYGYHVCPFLDDLSLVEIGVPVVIAVGLHFLAHKLIEQGIDRMPLGRRVTSMFVLDWLLFTALGGFVAVFNFYAHGFPAGSGGKVVVGFAALGLYISLDLALRRDLKLALRLRDAGVAFPITDQFLPYQTKFILFSWINVFILSVIGVLVALKDIEWIRSTEMATSALQRLVLIDAAVVLTVLGSYIMLVVRQYSRKIAFSLSEENATLRAVRVGDLSSRVAVISNDEFGHLAHLTNAMIGRLERSIDEVERSKTATIRAMVSLAAQRDNETGLHLKRTQIYVELLARQLQKSGRHDGLDDEAITMIVKAAPLHDIGKVGVPDAVLRKPGKLDDDEFAIMHTHTTIGADALREASATLGESPFLVTAIAIAEHHHERWDGRGYPSRLSGDAIPLAARIMAVADVYDALRSARVYKPARSHAEASAIIFEGAGTHFDPAVVDAFRNVEQDFARIADELQDQHGTPSGQPMAA